MRSILESVYIAFALLRGNLGIVKFKCAVEFAALVKHEILSTEQQVRDLAGKLNLLPEALAGASPIEAYLNSTGLVVAATFKLVEVKGTEVSDIVSSGWGERVIKRY